MIIFGIKKMIKAKKKMIVEKDLDMRCGAKSLFPSIRIPMFAVQIAKHGKITQYLWYYVT